MLWYTFDTSWCLTHYRWTTAVGHQYTDQSASGQFDLSVFSSWRVGAKSSYRRLLVSTLYIYLGPDLLKMYLKISLPNTQLPLGPWKHYTSNGIKLVSRASGRARYLLIFWQYKCKAMRSSQISKISVISGTKVINHERLIWKLNLTGHYFSRPF